MGTVGEENKRACLSTHLSEGHSSLSASRGERQRPLPHPDQPHAVVQPPGSQPPLRDLEPATFPEQLRVFYRHDHVFKRRLRVPVRRVVVPKHRQRPHHRHALRSHRNKHHRLLAVLRHPGGAVRCRLSHENRQLAPGIARAAGPPLSTVDHVRVAPSNDGARDVRRVRRRHRGLRHGETRPNLTQ